jgi:C4-dicarboxylate-specific signal transduction histidine kinase
MIFLALYEDMAKQKLTREKFQLIKHKIEAAISLTLDNTNKAIKLVQSFKALSTHELPSKNQKINILKFLRQMEQQTLILYKPHVIKFTIECADNIDILSSQVILEGIFTQLIENSTLHGLVEEDNKAINIIVSKGSTYVTIIYRDNGCGLNNATAKQIFEPFFTTKRGVKNTGLGLTIVFNQITHRLQGNISINNDLNSGFEISIKLPFSIIDNDEK